MTILPTRWLLSCGDDMLTWGKDSTHRRNVFFPGEVTFLATHSVFPPVSVTILAMQLIFTPALTFPTSTAYSIPTSNTLQRHLLWQWCLKPAVIMFQLTFLYTELMFPSAEETFLPSRVDVLFAVVFFFCFFSGLSVSSDDMSSDCHHVFYLYPSPCCTFTFMSDNFSSTWTSKKVRFKC